jgi:DNA replication factor GINS
MSDNEIVNIRNLYRTILNEIQNDEIQQINSKFYPVLSEFIGKLKAEEYSGIEEKIKNDLVEKTSLLTQLIMKIRLEKTMTNRNIDITKFVDEERFIIDSSDEMKERKEMVLSSTLNGKTKVLESISKNHKTKPTSVRFLKNTEEFIGADSEKYGAFKPEDVATIPNQNAQELIIKNIAVKINIDK